MSILTIISREKWREYLHQARTLSDLAIQHDIKPFAAAIAGVGFIRFMLEGSGDTLRWWTDLITLESNDFQAKYGLDCGEVFRFVRRPPGGGSA